ncbi:chalcone isomerase family protein [Salegentibacter salegens]|uniref:Chalcone isomerase-like n=1 Tax=Salegentibacter salegens TaxID=143223 RepID=A0A1M7JCN6_9FLAO|nr:chalcone isomerase family protein [Salegentibacter salegens]PRX42805.1 chalcone isomerase-like protein [Salegentibacter salegens]SHM50633.1 Chalcone isomerase-like [Salegentibacter salegens]
MKKLLVLFVAVFGLNSISAQTEIGGATLPNTLEYGSEELILNGAGVREKFWMDMYAGGLYLKTKSGDASEIMNKDEAMAIKLHIVSKMITSQRMMDAVNEGFENATGGNTAPISAEIKKFISFFEDEINKGDIFDLVYLPNKGSVIYKNGKESGTIQGMEFKKALFGIWLSNEPADDDLKEGMLGEQ